MCTLSKKYGPIHPTNPIQSATCPSSPISFQHSDEFPESSIQMLPFLQLFVVPFKKPVGSRIGTPKSCRNVLVTLQQLLSLPLRRRSSFLLANTK